MSRILYEYRKGSGGRGVKARLMIECKCGHMYNATLNRAAALKLTRCKECRYIGQAQPKRRTATP